MDPRRHPETRITNIVASTTYGGRAGGDVLTATGVSFTRGYEGSLRVRPPFADGCVYVDGGRMTFVGFKSTNDIDAAWTWIRDGLGVTGDPPQIETIAISGRLPFPLPVGQWEFRAPGFTWPADEPIPTMVYTHDGVTVKVFQTGGLIGVGATSVPAARAAVREVSARLTEHYAEGPVERAVRPRRDLERHRRRMDTIKRIQSRRYTRPIPGRSISDRRRERRTRKSRRARE